MKKLIIAFCILAGQAFGQTQVQTIRGQVVDTHSKQPIIGANIVLENSEPILGSITDVNGYFELKDVPVGRQSLFISFVGYEPARIPEILVGSGKEVVLDVTLTESFLALDEIVITSGDTEGMPQNEMVSVSAMSFNVEETSRYAATFDDPGRAALSFPGVRGSGDDLTNEIVIRGNSPRGMLWRIEGIEVPNPNHFSGVGSSGGGISMLSNNMLRNTDFYTGAFPGEFGNATSGVFDIHLRNGNHDQSEYAFEASLLGLQAAAEGPLSKKSNGSYLFNYRYSTLGLLDDIGVPIDGAIRFQDLSGKVLLPTKNAGTFTLWGLGGTSGQQIEADVETEDYYNENFQQTYGVVGLKHILYLDPQTYLETGIAGSLQTNVYTEDSLQIIDEYEENFTNSGFRGYATVNRKFNARHTARAGVIFSGLGYDYLDTWYNRDDGTYVTSLDDSGHSGKSQAFLLWQYRVTESFTLNTGVHYMSLHLNKSNSLEPRAGFRWNVNPNQVISGGAGLHSRSETPAIYLSQRMNEDGQYQQYNKELGFTKSAHYVLGYENMAITDLKLKAEIYYQHLFNVPIVDALYVEEPWMEAFSALNQSDGYTSLPLSNDGFGRNYGIELTLEKFFTRSYYIMATGSLFESKYKAHQESYDNTRYNGQFIANVLGGKEIQVGKSGNNSISFNGRVLFSGNNRETPIDLDASIAEGHSVYDWSNPYGTRLPNYFRLDVGLKYIKNKANHTSSISLNLQNLTNRLNAGGEYFNADANAIQRWEQMGIIPNLAYRIEF